MSPASFLSPDLFVIALFVLAPSSAAALLRRRRDTPTDPNAGAGASKPE